MKIQKIFFDIKLDQHGLRKLKLIPEKYIKVAGVLCNYQDIHEHEKRFIINLEKLQESGIEIALYANTRCLTFSSSRTYEYFNNYLKFIAKYKALFYFISEIDYSLFRYVFAKSWRENLLKISKDKILPIFTKFQNDVYSEDVINSFDYFGIYLSELKNDAFIKSKLEKIVNKKIHIFNFVPKASMKYITNFATSISGSDFKRPFSDSKDEISDEIMDIHEYNRLNPYLDTRAYIKDKKEISSYIKLLKLGVLK